MADLVLRWGWQRRMTHAQMKELKRQMKLAQNKLSDIQEIIDQHDLIDSIQADQMLQQQLWSITNQDPSI